MAVYCKDVAYQIDFKIRILRYNYTSTKLNNCDSCEEENIFLAILILCWDYKNSERKKKRKHMNRQK